MAEKGSDRGADEGTRGDLEDKGSDRGVAEIVADMLTTAPDLGGFLVIAFVSPVPRKAGNGDSGKQGRHRPDPRGTKVAGIHKARAKPRADAGSDR